ncbi:MAG: PDZ domain-containing protein [Pirellulaceae bacterium]
MRRCLPFAVFVLMAAAAWPAQAQLLKKLEEKLKAAVAGAAPAEEAPTPAAAPKPAVAPDDGELPPPAPDGERPQAGYLGVEGANDPAGGVRVEGFRPAGKAKAAGLKVGDRITAVNGKQVDDQDEFGSLLEKTLPGDTVTLRVIRGGKEQEFKVTLVDPPAVPAEPTEVPGIAFAPDAGGPLVAPRAAPIAGRASLGITVITLTDELRERLGVPVRRGAVITMVRPGSPADRAGVPVDAVVVAMDGQMVANSEELVELIRGAKPGTETELSYYVGDKLARKSVKLAPATVISTLPPGYGSERPLNLGPPGASRPLLSRVEKVVEGLTKPAAAAGPNSEDIVALQQSYSNLQAQMKLLVDRIDELEARLKLLEDAAASKPAEAVAPKPKPSVPRAGAPKLEAPKLEAPDKP